MAVNTKKIVECYSCGLFVNKDSLSNLSSKESKSKNIKMPKMQ